MQSLLVFFQKQKFVTITIASVLKPVRKKLIFVNLLHVLIKSTESSSTCLDRSISKIRSVPLHVWDKTCNILFVQSYRNEKCTNCFKFGRAVANFSAKRSCHPPLPQPRIWDRASQICERKKIRKNASCTPLPEWNQVLEFDSRSRNPSRPAWILTNAIPKGFRTFPCSPNA